MATKLREHHCHIEASDADSGGHDDSVFCGSNSEGLLGRSGRKEKNGQVELEKNLPTIKSTLGSL